jgi:hypothetical protein
MKNDKIEMPQVEEKVLRRFKVVRTAVIEFEFEVLAESMFDAEDIVEEHTSLTDYCDTYGAEYDDEYYDANGCISKIVEVQTGSGWWNNDSMLVNEVVGDEVSIFKMEEQEWDNADSVFETQEECIDAWKFDNEIFDNDDDDDDDDEK